MISVVQHSDDTKDKVIAISELFLHFSTEVTFEITKSPNGRRNMATRLVNRTTYRSTFVGAHCNAVKKGDKVPVAILQSRSTETQ